MTEPSSCFDTQSGAVKLLCSRCTTVIVTWYNAFVRMMKAETKCRCGGLLWRP